MRRKRFDVTRGQWNNWNVYDTSTGRSLKRSYQTRKDAEKVAKGMNASLRTPSPPPAEETA